MIPNLITQRDDIDRPTRECLHMQTAFLWSMRGLDPRLRVGALITSSDMRRILSYGYNGPAKQLPHEYVRDEPGNAGTLHAEENAILGLRTYESNMIMFVTHSPCEMCAQRILQADITRVFYCHRYRITTGLDLLRENGVKVNQMNAQGSLTVMTTHHQLNVISVLDPRASERKAPVESHVPLDQFGVEL